MSWSGVENKEAKVRGHRPDRGMDVGKLVSIPKSRSTVGRTLFGLGLMRLQPLALWLTGLTGLSLLCPCFTSDEDCVLGIVGRPVLLPCFHPEFLTLGNRSAEWKRNDEVVLRSVWQGDEHMEMWGYALAKLSDHAAQTGNFSLELLEVSPENDNMSYTFFIPSEQNQTDPLCTVCLRIAASFSSPQLHREEGEQGELPVFLCQSSGGYPEPRVYWIINDTDEPPDGSVRTQKQQLPDSNLYNITSHMTVNISKEASVSCIIQNLPMNETFTSTIYGAPGGPVVTRASDAMWMFSTGLCVVVGIMVITGVAYQIHLDRISKRKKKEFQKSERGRQRHRFNNEPEATKMMSKETDV
ncbi:ICOS ligand-like [Gouania willdenowi]|uniref:ICOS ligand-like n=1 Tax=Gouania willdenowi TaxID=441366 RepID=UPI001054532E|nr:ICOS ligand-like [Gouania willdenowi]XP_028301175.1 ICOS ligand-like [Gouania willdenowi]